VQSMCTGHQAWGWGFHSIGMYLCGLMWWRDGNPKLQNRITCCGVTAKQLLLSNVVLITFPITNCSISCHGASSQQILIGMSTITSGALSFA
jgi:hypothetical protein